MGKTPQKNSGNLSAAETKKRATDALRRALTTPYKPQREMRRPRKSPVKTTTPKSP
jgi:hypothetical protein